GLEPGDDPEQRRFARARRAGDDAHLSLGELRVESVEDPLTREALPEALYADGRAPASRCAWRRGGRCRRGRHLASRLRHRPEDDRAVAALDRHALAEPD